MNKVLTLSLGLSLLTACARHQVPVAPEEKHLTFTDSLLQIITVEPVEFLPVNNELLLNGCVAFDESQVAQVYPLYGGTITQVPVEAGDYVKKGDLLAEIRSSEVSELDKQREEAAHHLKLANRNLTSVKQMHVSGMASERDLLEAEQEVAVAVAEQKRIDETFALHHLEGDATYRLTAPVSGFVIYKQISRNMQIRLDQIDPFFTISGLSNVWIMADVYESDIRKIRTGASVRITTLAYGPEESFTGTVDKIYNLLDPESRTMKIRIKLNNETYMLKPGMFTNVYVDCQQDGLSMLRVSAKSVVFDNGKHYVITIGPDGYFLLNEIVLYKQNDQYCYLSEGPEAGRSVVGENALLVYNALK